MVTGRAGFIDSHVFEALLAERLRVAVVDDLSTGSRENVADRAELEVVEVVDISDRARLDRVIDAMRTSAIQLLGAQSSVSVGHRS